MMNIENKIDKNYGLGNFNTTQITRVCSTLLSLLGLPPTDDMAGKIPKVINAAEKKFGKNDEVLCDRIFMYNPDAIAAWIYGKYHKKYFSAIEKKADLLLPMLSVMPSVTPVCFASMYSGLMPEVHGIQSYTKPVLKCTTIFDKLIEAKKKVAIVSTEGDSISLIFLEREMDYFIYKTVAECNAKAAELIKKDAYDVIVLYNTDYDYWMHRNSPTGPLAVRAIKQDVTEYLSLYALITKEWQGKHRTALAFAPDHGCHRWLGILGQHGINEPCDMNINHLWSFV